VPMSRSLGRGCDSFAGTSGPIRAAEFGYRPWVWSGGCCYGWGAIRRG